jgi:TetR/AcrR family transcriptional regulator of autoinduction and epiphytic fitness
MLQYQQRVSAEKSSTILEVAIEMFLETGYEASRMDAIGDRAGVSYATLYKHFASKDVLFIEAVDYLIHQLFSRWKEHAVPNDVEAGLYEIGRAFYELVSDARLVATMRVVIAQVRNHPDVGRRFQQAKHLFSDVTDNWISKRVEEGALRTDNVQLARTEFIGMLSEVFFYPRLTVVDYSISDAQVAKVLDSAVSTFVARYRPPKSGKR